MGGRAESSLTVSALGVTMAGEHGGIVNHGLHQSLRQAAHQSLSETRSSRQRFTEDRVPRAPGAAPVLPASAMPIDSSPEGRNNVQQRFIRTSPGRYLNEANTPIVPSSPLSPTSPTSEGCGRASTRQQPKANASQRDSNSSNSAVPSAQSTPRSALSRAGATALGRLR